MATPLADLCKQQEITFDELVERSGLEPGRVQAIYLGRWTPSPNERQRIADVFGVEKEDVVWGHVTPIQHIWGHGPS